jgi:hypothetical protein
MALSILVGNGAQLTTMVGVTLGMFFLPRCTARKEISRRWISVRFAGIPFALQQRFSSNCYVDMLDVVRIVRMLIIFIERQVMLFCTQRGRLHIQPGLHFIRRH